MELESKVVWRDGMAFDAHLDGFSFAIDAAPEFGGKELGPRPKGLLLTALVGCTAMDVVAILNKMRVPVRHFEVRSRGVLTDTHPKKYQDIVVSYHFEGDALPVDRLLRAVELSETRYCGVSATLEESVALSSEVWLNGEKVDAPAK